MEEALGPQGVAYACRGERVERGPRREGDLFAVAMAHPDVVVQLDVDLDYIIVMDERGRGEAGKWRDEDDRAGEALRWLEEALGRR